GEVDVELADRLLLVRRQRERKRLAVAQREVARLAERRRERRLTLACATGDPDLQQEQLVEGEPAAAELGLVLAARAVQRDERIGPQRKPLACAQVRWERVDVVRRVRERVRDERADRLRCELFARGIDGREVG